MWNITTWFLWREKFRANERHAPCLGCVSMCKLTHYEELRGRSRLTFSHHMTIFHLNRCCFRKRRNSNNIAAFPLSHVYTQFQHCIWESYGKQKVTFKCMIISSIRKPTRAITFRLLNCEDPPSSCEETFVSSNSRLDFSVELSYQLIQTGLNKM